ncbi:MAG: 2-polyprenyl-3-methyl-5-hydroxy-6-metoxy-1,4-benzoquinol methylase [Flexibacter sp. CG_4_10_14_3_um_filter_32_15]|nr:MAG: 2-polyprenyl-3-methyl-5-hydroxy-6-metoxy-1,4-benzoquinol methylase [Flexibacter sp. CG_4_10_14_3_um_filter_32_15]
MNCTLCETLLKNKADEFYFICDTCGAYLKDQKFYLNNLQEKDVYSEHQNDVNDIRYQNFTSPITNVILEKFTSQHLGLDYGCGTGPVISKVLYDKGYKVELYDPYFYPNENYLNHKYDYIFSCEVFEHFYNPKQEIEKLLAILKPTGALLVMTHIYDFETDVNFKDWYYRKDPTHVFIYTVKTIQFIADRYNLEAKIEKNRMVVFSKVSNRTKLMYLIF